jgi:hypothetical protein
MRATLWWCIAAGVAILLAMGWSHSRPENPVVEVSGILDRSVRRGMTIHDVESALDSLGVEHSRYRSEERVIHAVWRGFRRELVTESAVEATFEFSTVGRLLHWELREVFIGP